MSVFLDLNVMWVFSSLKWFGGGLGGTSVYAAEQSKLSANYTCGEYSERDTIPKVLHWSMSNKVKSYESNNSALGKYEEQNSKKISNRWQLQNSKTVQKMYSTVQGVNHNVIAV